MVEPDRFVRNTIRRPRPSFSFFLRLRKAQLNLANSVFFAVSCLKTESRLSPSEQREQSLDDAIEFPKAQNEKHVEVKSKHPSVRDFQKPPWSSAEISISECWTDKHALI